MDVHERLPENLEWYKDQVAGHHPTVVRNGLREIVAIFGDAFRNKNCFWCCLTSMIPITVDQQNSNSGIIKERDSKIILKVVQEGVRGEREIQLYKSIEYCSPSIVPNLSENGECSSHLTSELQKFLPKYYGRRTLRIGQKDVEFLQLEDITYPFNAPCIMDIKIGRVTYDPTANEKKKLAESSKCLCQKAFGFRVLGYRINSECNEPKERDRIWGKALTEENIQEAFEEYLLRGNPSESLTILDEFIARISAIKYWFDRQERFHFYASSLLLVYEGDPSKKSDKNLVDVRMIDFSHVFLVDSGKDHNYIHGINYILDVFTKIRQKLVKNKRN